MLEFFLTMESPPTTTAQQGSRTTKAGHHYVDPAVRAIKDRYRQALLPHKPDTPITNTPIRLTVKFLYPPTIKHTHGTPKTTKPDCSNIIKSLEDAMQDCGYFTNDSAVASLIVEKYYSEVTGIYIKIEPLPSPAYPGLR